MVISVASRPKIRGHVNVQSKKCEGWGSLSILFPRVGPPLKSLERGGATYHSGPIVVTINFQNFRFFGLRLKF